ncbi:MAG: dienelactone hydrolase family protein [Bdellovibrionales bacterium]
MPDIKITSFEGSEFGAYLSHPPLEGGPGLIVIQEIFGVNDVMRKACDDFAAQGYLAICPDLFWRREPNVQLTDRTPEDIARAYEMYKSLNVEDAVRDLLSVLGYIRKTQGCNGKVGSVGYGLGGRLSYLMATRSDVDASVGYYPTHLEKNLDEIHDIRMPVLLHFGALDKSVPPDKRIKIMHSLARNPVVMARVYENADQGFGLAGGKNYNEVAATLAASRTKDFLAEKLMT